MKVKIGNFEFVIRRYRAPCPKVVVKPEKAKLPPLEILNSDDFDRDCGDIRVLLHHGDGMTGSEHIYRQWRDVFVASGVPFLALFRHRKIYERVAAEFPGDPLALLVGNEETPGLMARMPALRAIMYTGNTGNIVHMLQFQKLKHCFIGHGDSDKNASATNVFRVYDEIWVAGQAHIDRLKAFGSSWRFRTVGRPQAKSLMALSAENASSACYLPTWEGPNANNSYCSLDLAEKVSSVLSETHKAVLGSGLIDQSQKITVAARAMAERKTIGHLS